MSETKLRCYLAGAESLLIHCAEALLQRGHVICGVVTEAPQLTGWARDVGIPTMAPGADLASRLSEPFDYFFSITNLSMIRPDVLALARCGGINFHDGPLPRYAGLYVTAWALMQRETTHGVTWHVMTEGADEGDILEQMLFDLRGDETSFGLNTRCYEAAIESFGALIDKLASGAVTPRAQDLTERSYFGLTSRPAAAATLDWTKTAEELAALVRALDFGPVNNPLALPKFVAGDELITTLSAEVVDGGGAPGTVLRIDDDTVVVATGDGALALGDLRCPRGVPVALADLAARHGLREGAVLGCLSADAAARLSEVNQAVCRYERFWTDRLDTLTPVEIPYADRSGGPAQKPAHAALDLSRSGLSADELVTALHTRPRYAASAVTSSSADSPLRDRSSAACAGFCAGPPLRSA